MRKIIKKPKHKIVCVQCGKCIFSFNPSQKTCGVEECRMAYYHRNRFQSRRDLSSGTIGAMTELKVAAYLMDQGYAVFRALSPASFCDLIALKPDENMYIEVRTGSVSHKGNLAFPKKIHTTNGIPTHFAVHTYLDNKTRIIKIDATTSETTYRVTE